MSTPLGQRERYQRRQRNPEFAVKTDRLREMQRARQELRTAGMNPDSHPVLRNFIAYLCQNPGVFSFKGLSGEAELQMYRDANKAGYRLRECFRMLQAYKDADCSDDDLKEAMLRAVGGRWAYVVEPLVWDEWIQYTPKEDWANEYRVAGKALLDYCISEKQWQ